MINVYVVNLESFNAGLDAIPRDLVEKAVQDEHRKLASRILQAVVMGTPVDTGTARGGWDVVPRANSRLTGRMDKSGASTISIGIAKVGELTSRATPYTVIYIQNNVHYIGVLDRVPGHSAQAPMGIVNVALASVGAFYS